MGASTKKQLTGELRALEESTGWKLRLLTSYGAVSAPPVREAQQYWRADPKTIVVTVDETKGNVVEFYYDLGQARALFQRCFRQRCRLHRRRGPRVLRLPATLTSRAPWARSQSVKTTIPKSVFQELRGRYGNVYYLRESGAESAVVEVLGALRGCLAQGGCVSAFAWQHPRIVFLTLFNVLVCGRCKFVPGLSEQQRQFSLISITSGAFLSGAVLRNGLSRWTYIFLFIWVPWIGLVRRAPAPNTT
jgi:hypothetical protein